MECCLDLSPAVKGIGLDTFLFILLAFVAGTATALFSSVLLKRMKELRRNMQQAQVQTVDKSGRIKIGFLSNISHEIRTPMNAIIGMTDQLSATSLNPEQKEMVNVLKRASDSLMVVISDIIDISQVSSGHLKLNLADLDLKKIFDEVVTQFTPQAFSKGLKLECDYDSATGQKFYGDSQRIKQILTNLLSNAVKFTHQGKVRITIGPNFDPSKRGNLLVIVSDTGVGISSEKQGKLFEAFQQGDDSVTKKFGGTGLGLAICKRLIEMMGGQIWIQSEEDRGTAISFTIECKSTTTQPVASNTNKSTATEPLNILLVDDYEDNRLLIRSYLKKFSHKITEAENGKEALEKVKASNFDLVFMDIQMPVLDGYSATRAIRDHEAKNGTPRAYIVAVTAYSLKNELDRTIASGCDEYRVKPVVKQTIIELVDKVSKTKSKQAA